MERAPDYIIITGNTPAELEGAIGVWIAEGFVPQGGVAVEAVAAQGSFGQIVSDRKYHQAIVKAKKDEA